MKEVYLVMESSGEYEDYRSGHTGTVFLSLLSAEKVKQGIIEYNSTEEPFPFTHCTEEEFLENSSTNRNMDEEELIYDRWVNSKYRKQEFNNCWIEILELNEES